MQPFEVGVPTWRRCLRVLLNDTICWDDPAVAVARDETHVFRAAISLSPVGESMRERCRHRLKLARILLKKKTSKFAAACPFVADRTRRSVVNEHVACALPVSTVHSTERETNATESWSRLLMVAH